jgi:hypothetical protein
MKTRNEKILVGLLLLIVFVAGNVYGLRWLAQRQHELDLSRAELRADKAEAEVDLQKQSLWTERRQWIDQHEPVMGDEGDTKAQVLQSVLKGARDNKMEVLQQSLDEVEQGTGGTRVSVQLKVKGSTQSLCSWLAALQKPENFYAVPQLSLKVDSDEKSMICTLQLARYFKSASQ